MKDMLTNEIKWIVYTFKRVFLLIFKKIECRIKIYLLNKSAKKAFSIYKKSHFKKIMTSVRKGGWLSLFFISLIISITITITWVNIRFASMIFFSSDDINTTIEIEKRIIIPEKDGIIQSASGDVIKSPPQPLSTDKIGPRIRKDLFKDLFEDDIEFGILVDKRKKELLVVQNIGRYPKVVEKFSVSLGKYPGDKEREGDMKTPEGRYKIIDIKKNTRLLPQYGPMVFVLNYPNEMDQIMGKTGSGIWIHGTANDEITPDTKGCIAINNRDLLRFARYASNGTPVVILPAESNIWEETSY